MNVIRDELETKLAVLSAAFARGADARAIGDLMYEEDVVVIGEGDHSATRGLTAFMPTLAAHLEEWGGKPNVTFKLIDPILTEGNVASAFLDITLIPSIAGALTQHYRSMFGWRRSAKGWRVALEMYAAGVT
jgi:hypothetical protein